MPWFLGRLFRAETPTAELSFPFPQRNCGALECSRLGTLTELDFPRDNRLRSLTQRDLPQDNRLRSLTQRDLRRGYPSCPVARIECPGGKVAPSSAYRIEPTAAHIGRSGKPSVAVRFRDGARRRERTLSWQRSSPHVLGRLRRNSSSSLPWFVFLFLRSIIVRARSRHATQ
jgi:hypothetical protein